MILSQLLKKTGFSIRPAKTIGDMGIHRPSAFKRILERECARADRTGSHLALVGFGAGNSNNSMQVQAKLIALLKKRIRLTDELGWLVDNRIGLLLFNADAASTARFMHSLKNNGLDPIPNISYTIYLYPCGRPDGRDRGSGLPKKPKLSRSQGPHPLRDQDSTIPNESRIHRSMEIADDQQGSAIVAPTESDSIKTLLLKVPLWKRLLDIAGASSGLVIFAPLFIMVAIHIKLVSPGPVFFKQARIGYGGRNFRMWKFRTMHVGAEQNAHRQLVNDLLEHNDLPMNKLADDARIIPLGKLLRKCCIDELPQLINVFKGEMSLVGPRPDPVYAIDHYTDWYAARFDAMPGMTGLWQVSGKNQLSFQQMMRLDIAYARQRALWLDLKILLITIPAIVWNVKHDA